MEHAKAATVISVCALFVEENSQSASSHFLSACFVSSYYQSVSARYRIALHDEASEGIENHTIEGLRVQQGVLSLLLYPNISLHVTFHIHLFGLLSSLPP
jgi:hypothetical protein